MIDYRDLFSKVEQTLQQKCTRYSFLERFKDYQVLKLSDSEYFDILIAIIFYSGFKAETVTKKIPIIRSHFREYINVAMYGESEIENIMRDPEMIRNERKIRACVANAQTFTQIIGQNGSFENYINLFQPHESFENLMLLKEDLESKLEYLGGITSYHFLTDIGLPVLKPDRVITRIFKRLGLIDDERQLLKTVIHGRKFAHATNFSNRYIDLVFVKYGQVGAEPELGLDDGICLEKKPKCDICGVKQYCIERFNHNKTGSLGSQGH